jgi:predicted Zn-ribbon and HTH transcriptional regulator
MSTRLASIAIKRETRQLLQEHAKKSQTYDDFLRELVVRPTTCPHCGREVEEKAMSESGHGLATQSAVRQNKKESED